MNVLVTWCVSLCCVHWCCRLNTSLSCRPVCGSRCDFRNAMRQWGKATCSCRYVVLQQTLRMVWSFGKHAPTVPEFFTVFRVWCVSRHRAYICLFWAKNTRTEPTTSRREYPCDSGRAKRREFCCQLMQSSLELFRHFGAAQSCSRTQIALATTPNPHTKIEKDFTHVWSYSQNICVVNLHSFMSPLLCSIDISV
jgi:hypothetical protein